jgi:O-antigen/teichoic acid export membrane protein
MFFDPAVITVRTLALKVNDVMNQFVGNFRTAVNPQIVKKYAAGDQEGSKKLALASAQYTYYLMLALVLPLFLLIDPALKTWLEEVPEGLPVFVRLALLQALFQTFDNSFYIPIYAKGQIKENAIISPLFDFLQLPAIYILFKIGFPPVTLAWVQMIAFLCLGVIIKPVLVHIIVKYSYKEMMLMILRCLAVTLLASAAPCAASYFLEENSIIGFITVLIVSLISVGLFVWFAGIDKQMKSMLIQWIKGKSSKDQEQL